MNLRDLKYLVALGDLRHFGKAAKACFISQPTLSAQIMKLEEELGVKLVERAPRRVMLTAAGQDVAQRARRILAEVEELREAARRCINPEVGRLRLGVFPTLAPYLLPHVVPELHTRYPRLELLLTEEKSDILLQRLRDGALDAALLALPIHDDRLHAQFLFEEPFRLAAPEGHPLAAHKTLTVESLDKESLLLLEDGHCLRDQALDVCRLAGAHETPGFRATSLETLRQMVASGVGVTLLPLLSVLEPIVQPSGLQLVKFRKPAPSRRIALVWRKSSALDDFLGKIGQDIAGKVTPLLRAG
ncbi:LysR substrate-binding domain-containing protein [Thermomonas sp.]|uniref:LysR substrate-binding domain-containing protein n=1 Tax=Thermomonas sp. TaxID=1971895 RepID=UPI001D20261F|nr:LysR substrate-binding domain-containing protein [Thermomonas sp.]MBZ0088718.1 LysR family transcriptional regulator [Thermomonas sp.]